MKKPISKPSMFCKDCHYKVYKQCHRMPPVPVVKPSPMGNFEYVGVWPQVDDFDSCGEWSPSP